VLSDSNPWDYIVVGAGSAGCVLAGRLSEDGSRRVLVLEAGPRETALMKPFGLSYYFDMSRFEWGFWSQPDPTRNMRTDHWRRGRVVGGSGSVNGMNYVRGTRADYDRWAAMGNAGWSADDVMPLFQALERCAAGSYESPPDYNIRGASGPLWVREVQRCHPLTDAFLQAAQAAGFTRTSDYNGAQQEGVGYGQFNQRRGLRWSSVDAFLKPALRRKNLQLITDALVHKVLINDGRATGVRFECEGVMREARAGKVIVCAGTINTPQILMLSGIGDSKALQPHGIDVVVDRPSVGRNMMEHPLIRPTFRVKQPSYSPTEGIWQKAGFLAKFLLTGQGPIATITEAQAFLRTSPAEPAPDVQMHFSLAGAVYSDDTFYKSLKVLPYPSISIFINKSYPLSRGQVRLASADPKAAPLIEPNLLGDERDVQTLVRGIGILRRIVAAPPLAGMVREEVEPGKQATSHDALVDYVKGRTGLAYHAAGTCRMGIDEDAVVTPELNVRGVEKLWIADASVMPHLVSGNVNAACMMIGEKLARQLGRHA
jgi:choline dehydrogenase